MLHMSRRELAEKYGKNKNSTQRLNAAIRAEIPGGSEALDALDSLRFAGNEQGAAAVRSIIAAMAAEIRRRYNLPSADS
jgi:hypothetical protein